MGEHIFVVTLITLFMLLWIDVFKRWYVIFLTRRGMSRAAINTMMRIFWVLLTMVFWYTLLHRGMPKEFTITHFAYVLFVFCLYHLIQSFTRSTLDNLNKDEKEKPRD